MLSSNQGVVLHRDSPDNLFPAGKRRITVKLDSRAPHVVSAGDHGIVLQDRADERTIQTGLNTVRNGTGV